MAHPPNIAETRREVYLRLTRPSEGGFSDKVPVIDKKTKKVIRSDGHVTLFGMTATAYAEHILREPTAAGLAKAEGIFKRVGPYVQRNGNNIDNVPPDIAKDLDTLRAHSYQIWETVHLTNQRFDRFRSPVLQGIAADISFHMGVDGAYRILAKAANIEIPKDLKDPVWRESVLTAISAMEQRDGAETTIQRLADAKIATHTSIREFWVKQRELSIQRLTTLGDNTTQAYADEYYKRYKPADTRAGNHLAWQKGFETRASSYTPLFRQMAGQAVTLPKAQSVTETEEPAQVVVPLKEPTLNAAAGAVTEAKETDAIQELLLSLDNTQESALKLIMSGRIKNIQITDGTRFNLMGINADPKKNPNIATIAANLLKLDHITFAIVGDKAPNTMVGDTLTITVPDYEAARKIASERDIDTLGGAARIETLQAADPIRKKTAAPAAEHTTATAPHAKVPQIIKDWIAAGRIKIGGSDYHLPKIVKPEELDRKILEDIGGEEVTLIAGRGPLADKIREWLETVTLVKGEIVPGSPLISHKPEDIRALDESIKAHQKTGRRASVDIPVATQVNFALANVGVTAAKEGVTALPPDVRTIEIFSQKT